MGCRWTWLSPCSPSSSPTAAARRRFRPSAEGQATITPKGFFPSALAAAAGLVLLTPFIEHTLRAQAAGRTVADGVYTDAQARRGAAVYDNACSGCHRPDLGGNTGPALKEQRFTKEFAGKDLKTLFTKIATTMPRNAPASMGDDVYLDIVAHLLKENGFPAGSADLTADALGDVRVLPGKRPPPPPVTDFSYVEVVGCLMRDPANLWVLTHASEPVIAKASGQGTQAGKNGIDKPLGTQTFHLLDAMAYSPVSHKGQKMYVRGLLIRLPSEQRMAISAIEMVAPTCPD